MVAFCMDFDFVAAPGAWPWDRSTGFDGIDMERTPCISPPALGTIKSYHLLSENVKFHNFFFSCLNFKASNYETTGNQPSLKDSAKAVTIYYMVRADEGKRGEKDSCPKSQGPTRLFYRG